jgi:hypothetical protein
LRIPDNVSTDQSPAPVLSHAGIGPGIPVAIEDDVSLIWLTDQSQTTADVATRMANRGIAGGGEIFAGTSLKLSFSDPLVDSRSRGLSKGH